MSELGEKEFALFQELIHREAGIHLTPRKTALLKNRLGKRLKALGLTSFTAYYRKVVLEGDREELHRMLDAVSTNETRFFREPHHFSFLERQVFPAWCAAPERLGQRIRVWSAGCATGEEPYSLAMLLLAHFPGWRVEVLATDLSGDALERARRGIWPIGRAAEVPETYLKRFMRRGVKSQLGFMAAGPEVRAVVRFERLNLVDERWDVEGPFDAVFCRNVMIYFDAPTKARVVDRLVGRLAGAAARGTGYLFLGHAESLLGSHPGLRNVGPTTYVLDLPGTL